MRNGADRRRNASVPYVRDWITELRSKGGDFTPMAAREAGRAAYQAAKAGVDKEAVFELARTTYYLSLVEPREERPQTKLRPVPRRRTAARVLASATLRSPGLR